MLPLNQVAYQHIRKKLLAGELRGGARLSEIALANELSVSRTPVREAIAQLEREGLIDQIPRHGTYVRLMDQQELEELYDFREHLEAFVVRRAAEHASPQQLTSLLQSCRRMMALIRQIRDAPPDHDPDELEAQWRLADAEFHMALIDAANNRWVEKVAVDLHLMSRVFSQWQQPNGTERLRRHVRVVREHRRLVRTLRQRDAVSAEAQITAHIRQGRREMWRYFANQSGQPRSSDLDRQFSSALQEQVRKMERYLTPQRGQADAT